jgi:hypothetical protein
MTALTIGLAAGIGNAAYMLPAIKALKLLGHRIALYIQTDYPSADLWRRCIYADELLQPPMGLNGHQAISGHWAPPAWNGLRFTKYPMRYIPPFTTPEWQSNMRIAKTFGWNAAAPCVADWCRDLDRTPRWDVGIVPGSKPDIWLRKRWPGMAQIAAHFLSLGRSIAVFGLEQDGVAEIPGEHVDTLNIGSLPDALAGCRVIVGTDSGVSNVASSLGIPTVIIYTATSEIKNQPLGPHKKIMADVRCRPCQSTPAWQACRDWKCQKINPASVIGAAEEFLRSK